MADFEVRGVDCMKIIKLSKAESAQCGYLADSFHVEFQRLQALFLRPWDLECCVVVT